MKKSINPAKPNTKASPKAKAKPTPETDVDRVLAHLIKHKDEVGAIVCVVAAKPGARVTSFSGGKCEGFVLTAEDATLDRWGKDSRHSLLTRGLVASLASMHLDKRGSFG